MAVQLPSRAFHKPPLEEPADEAVAELRATLERAVRRICPRWLADRAEDLVQVATLRALEACPRREGKFAVATSYLYRVAYTTLIDEIRRVRRRPEAPLDEVEAAAGAPPTRTPGPDQEYAALEVGRAIRSCLLGLVPPRRQAVTLHLQGHTIPQAAAILGWVPKRVENLVYRGLADLRECLKGRGVVP